MKKVCLIVPNKLTVPAVLGGAIETLVTLIIDANEKHNELELTVVAPYNEQAYILSKNYKYTKFIYIKKNISYYFTSCLFKLINKTFKKNYCTYNHFVIDKIKNEDFDYVIVEGGEYASYKKILKYFDRNKMILHLHHEWHSNKIIDETFSKVIGVSNYVTEEFKKSSNINTYNVLKNAIDLSKFIKKNDIKSKKELINKFKFKEDDFIVLYCGRLVEVKGVLELVKAIKSIDNEHIKLLIVGSSNFANAKKNEYILNLEKEIEICKDRVQFTGYINNADLYKYYELIDVLCVPSICNEAAGLTAIEGMASSKPLIVTNNGGLPEYICKDGAIVLKTDKDFINNLKEAIISLYQNKKSCEEMGRNNLLESKKYDYLKFYQNFVNIINNYKD